MALERHGRDAVLRGRSVSNLFKKEEEGSALVFEANENLNNREQTEWDTAVNYAQKAKEIQKKLEDLDLTDKQIDELTSQWLKYTEQSKRFGNLAFGSSERVGSLGEEFLEAMNQYYYKKYGDDSSHFFSVDEAEKYLKENTGWFAGDVSEEDIYKFVSNDEITAKNGEQIRDVVNKYLRYNKARYKETGESYDNEVQQIEAQNFREAIQNSVSESYDKADQE